jgi:hypothetical protein
MSVLGFDYYENCFSEVVKWEDEFDSDPTFLSFSDEEEEEAPIMGDVNVLHDNYKSSVSLIEEMELPISGEPEDRIVGMEVGDDRVDLSTNTLKLALMLVVQETVCMMKTSKEDTYISPVWWNFCETTNPTPCSKLQSLEYARSKNTFSNIGFVDTLPLRIVIDTSKTDRSAHSSTTTGKASMIGRHLRATRPEVVFQNHLGSLLQDSYLRTYRMKDPKYLPIQMGGTGCPALFNEVVNLYLYVMTYRGGGYSRLYGTATQEAMDVVSQLDHGEHADALLCSRLRTRQEYYHGTYKHQVALPPVDDLKDATGGAALPLYKGVSCLAGFSSVEGRLRRAKLLATRTEATALFNRRVKIEQWLLQAGSVPAWIEDAKASRRRDMAIVGNAISANSALQRLIDKRATGNEMEILRAENWAIITHGASEFAFGHALWLHRGGKGVVYSIHDIARIEDMFLVEDVSVDDNFRVRGIPLTEQIRGDARIRPTISRAGLYQISGTQLEWCHRKVDQIKMIRAQSDLPLDWTAYKPVFTEGLEWVTDDGSLIARAVDLMLHSEVSDSIYLLSCDKKLARRMADTIGRTVLLVDPGKLAVKLGTRLADETFSPAAEDINRLFVNRRRGLTLPHHVLVDTGAVRVRMSEIDIEDGRYVTKTLSRTGRSRGRYELQVWEEIPITGRELSLLRVVPTNAKVRNRWYTAPYQASGLDKELLQTITVERFREYPQLEGI